MDVAALTKLADKVDKIAEDTNYLRGKYDSTIPTLVETVARHEKAIDAQGREISNIQGKATVAGVLGGSLMGVLVAWIYSKLHI